MNKKEIAEIKKLYGIKNCSITRIAGCYVDGEKNICSQFANAFLSLPEEVLHKYFAIFKKALSGSVGKNLLSFEFPMDTESEGGTQNSLLKLRNSGLKDDALLTAFYEKIIGTYDYVGNYLILLIHNAYDVPGKGTDNLEQDDASDEVYEYITCSICPVDLSKPGLTYDKVEDIFTNREQDRVVGAPEVSFTFPAFNDRASDIHAVLYYEKKADIMHPEMISEILGCRKTLPAPEQKKAFATLLEKCNCSSDEIMKVHEKLASMIEERKQQTADLLELNKTDVENIMHDCVSEDAMCRFYDAYRDCVGSSTVLSADNITDTKKLEIKNPDVVIKVSPDRGDLITEKVVDGVKCIVIEMGSDIEINGTRVTPGA